MYEDGSVITTIHEDVHCVEFRPSVASAPGMSEHLIDFSSISTSGLLAKRSSRSSYVQLMANGWWMLWWVRPFIRVESGGFTPIAR